MTRGAAAADRWRIVRYGVAGLASAGAHAAVYHALVLAGLSAHVAYPAGFAVSLVVSFALNGRFTFRSQRLSAAQFRRFALLVCASYALCQSLLFVLIEGLGANVFVAYWVLFPLPPAINYAGMRHWVFVAGRS